jgi:hypothetical protein
MVARGEADALARAFARPTHCRKDGRQSIQFELTKLQLN